MNKKTKLLREKLQTRLDYESGKIWYNFGRLYPRLIKYEMPEIVLNNYFTKTGGCCDQEGRIIDISSKFLIAFPATVLRVVLPHELAHQVDYDLFGESEKECGHGKKWRGIMLNYGLPDNPYHDMVL